ncbi:MAG TPA: hypothetical protein VMC43_01415 [Candidatus Paceibacterota bacterium]|nr:hypothetical protein [Candidatus Paceibacterota bacterium]
MKFLFVSRESAGRSQIAEKLFKEAAGSKHSAVSAGMTAETEDKEKESSQDVNATDILESLGGANVDTAGASEERGKRLTPKMVADADKVIIIGKDDTIPEYLRNSDKAVFWKDVPDTKNMPAGIAHVVRENLRKRIADLVKTSEAPSIKVKK